jgi:hypothetical protein
LNQPRFSSEGGNEDRGTKNEELRMENREIKK